MGFFDRIDRHAELFQRMARTSGTDIGDALLDGRLNAHELPGALLRCTACTSVEECRHWLETHESGEPPAYCRNRDLLARLAG